MQEKGERLYDSLGDRMKHNYENAYNIHLPRRMPLIIRLDGRSFSNFTKDCVKPFSDVIIKAMNQTALTLCKEIQGAQFAFLQSDEISILVHNYKSLQSQSWFDNSLQKIVSISAAVASVAFNTAIENITYYNIDKLKYKKAYFDSRAFVLPESEVANAFIWRQKNWERNSVQMLARSLYSHNECENKNNSELQEMIFKKGKNWNDLSTDLKRGRCAIQVETSPSDGVIRSEWKIDNEIPIFSQDREYINQLLAVNPVEEKESKE